MTLLEGENMKACNDSKVVRPTFECTPEIRVRCCVRIDNLSTGENDFEVHHVVARKAFASGEIRKAT
jgi:hypothetical protein